MATSAQTLSLIIDELLKAKPADRDAAITLLSAKGYLPKKLMEKPKEKKTSMFASKAAEDFAEAKGITATAPEVRTKWKKLWIELAIFVGAAALLAL